MVRILGRSLNSWFTMPVVWEHHLLLQVGKEVGRSWQASQMALRKVLELAGTESVSLREVCGQLCSSLQRKSCFTVKMKFSLNRVSPSGTSSSEQELSASLRTTISSFIIDSKC